MNGKGRHEMPRLHYMRGADGHICSTENPHFHLDCENLGRHGAALYLAQCRQSLRDMLAGSERPTIYCVLREVSRSGMSRRISFYILQDNRPRCVDHLVATIGAGGARQHATKDGLVVQGGGMDMGFHVVYSLSRSLYLDAPNERDAGYHVAHEWL